jgi:hydroxymethylpyrimidine/phosphomethylpyrimidine kinase
MTATTALTAQNTQGVFGIHHVPPEFVKKQIDACIDDIGVDVIKTGMIVPDVSKSLGMDPAITGAMSTLIFVFIYFQS